MGRPRDQDAAESSMGKAAVYTRDGKDRLGPMSREMQHARPTRLFPAVLADRLCVGYVDANGPRPAAILYGHAIAARGDTFDARKRFGHRLATPRWSPVVIDRRPTRPRACVVLCRPAEDDAAGDRERPVCHLWRGRRHELARHLTVAAGEMPILQPLDVLLQRRCLWSAGECGARPATKQRVSPGCGRTALARGRERMCLACRWPTPSQRPCRRRPSQQ